MPATFRTHLVTRRLAPWVLVACLVAGSGGCGGATATTPASAGVASASGAVAQSTTSTPAAETVPEDFIEALPAGLRQNMTGVSWRAGCPVALDDLRLVHVSYVDFDGKLRAGRLVVHKAIAEPALRVFQRLRAQQFPIRSMNLIEQYGGSDDASMASDNTSAFNCRNVPGTTHWSNHAYGRAIDVNTVENPYLPNERVMPPAGKEFLDRRDVRKGMIVAGDATVQAFQAEGFTWGGAWRNGTDYQHFEKA